MSKETLESFNSKSFLEYLKCISHNDYTYIPHMIIPIIFIFLIYLYQYSLSFDIANPY